MKYQQYTIEDFISDEFFVRWVNRPDAETDFFWKNWMEQHPEKVRLIMQARDIVTSFRYANPVQPTQLEYVEVLENIQRQAYKGKVSSFYMLKSTWLKYAAVISLLFMMSILLWRQSGSHSQNPNASAVSIRFVNSSTEKGQKKNLVLSDGTRIKLNAESTLEFPEKFSGNIREVYLEGEGFFEVAKDTVRSFIVHTGSVSTSVLGTSFNIKAYPENEEIRVAIVSGKVQVQDTASLEGQQSAILLPNDVFTANHLTEEMHIVRNADISQEIAWKEGKLIYDNKLLSDILQDLERWYGVAFIVDKNISLESTYTGTFDNQNLKNVMMGLSYASNFKYRIEGRKVYIYP